MIVVWRITQRCNLGCQFCGFDRQLTWARRDADPEQVRRFGTVLADYQKVTGDSVLVSWMGGEPWLWPALNKTTEFFVSLGLRVSATTNGFMLNSASTCAHLLKWLAELTVSVDGPTEFHDQVRKWPGGYATIRQGVGTLAAEKRRTGHGPLLRANVVLMRDNLHDFEPLCHELASWGIEEITFNQLGGNDRPEFYPQHRLRPEQAQWLTQILPQWRAKLATRGVRLAGGGQYLRRIMATTNSQPLPVSDCQPGRRFLFINEAGFLAPCNFTIHGYGYPLEHFPSIEQFRRLPDIFATAQADHRLPACDDCHCTQPCEKFKI